MIKQDFVANHTGYKTIGTSKWQDPRQTLAQVCKNRSGHIQPSMPNQTATPNHPILAIELWSLN